METQEIRTGIGCEYVNVDGQLTHPLLVAKIPRDLCESCYHNREDPHQVFSTCGRCFPDENDIPVYHSQRSELIKAPEIWIEVSGEDVQRLLAKPDYFTITHIQKTIDDHLIFQTIIWPNPLTALTIDTMIFFPFPKVAGVNVSAYVLDQGIDLVLVGVDDNVDHYSEEFERWSSEIDKVKDICDGCGDQVISTQTPGGEVTEPLLFTRNTPYGPMNYCVPCKIAWDEDSQYFL